MLLRTRSVRIRRAWPGIRATLVTLHCVAVALVAMPAPTGSSVIGPRDPRFAAEVHPWAVLFGLSDETFAQEAEAARTRWMAIRAFAIAPFERYLALIGSLQPWSMFSAPNRYPARLVLEALPTATADREGDWLFLSGLPAGPWRRSFFESERVRSFVNRIGRFEQWQDAEALCSYLAREALRDRRSWAKVRCRFVASPAPSWRDGAERNVRPRVLYSQVFDANR